MAEPRVTALIQVRLESERLPRKALANICGASMLDRIIRRLKRARHLGEIVVCSADTSANRDLAPVAEAAGVALFLGSEHDVLRRFADAARRFAADHVVRVTGDNPLVDPVVLDLLIDAHLDTAAMFSKAVDLPLGVGTEIIATALLHDMLTQMGDGQDTQHLLFFMFDPARHRCAVLEPEEAFCRPRMMVTVDTSDELERMRNIYRAAADPDIGPDFLSLMAYLEHEMPQVLMPLDQQMDLPGGRRGTFQEFCDWAEAAKQRSVRVGFSRKDVEVA